MMHGRSATQWVSITLMVLGIIGLMAGGGWIINQMQPVTIVDTYGEATVRIEVARGAVLLPNHCVAMNWQADGISAIYLDREGVGGADSRTTCINSTVYKPSLRVDFPGGTRTLYQPEISILLYDWVLWALFSGGLMMLLGGIAFYPAGRLQAQRRQFFTGQGLALLMGISLVLALYLFAPNPLIIYDLVDEAEITIEADRQWLLQPGGCVTASWDLQNVDTPYIWTPSRLNDSPYLTVDRVQEPNPLCITAPHQMGIYVQGKLLVYGLPTLVYLEPAFWAMILFGLLAVRQWLVVVIASPRVAEVDTILRVGLKVGILLLLVNLVYSLLQPLPQITRAAGPFLASYDRLPTADHTDFSLLTHPIAQPKAEDEFRVVVLGDSATFGLGLPTADTLTVQLNALQLTTNDGRNLQFYSLARPDPSFIKDVVWLNQALPHEPDMVLWPITMHNFRIYLLPEMLRTTPVEDIFAAMASCTDAMPELVMDLEAEYGYRSLFEQRDLLHDLIFAVIEGSNREQPPILADDTLRWDEQGVDFSIRSMHEETIAIFADCLAHIELPMLVVNEPAHAYTEEQSAENFNYYYTREEYTRYRDLLTSSAEDARWSYIDMADAVPNAEFTDTPLHTTPEGVRLYAETLIPHILAVANGG